MIRPVICESSIVSRSELIIRHRDWQESAFIVKWSSGSTKSYRSSMFIRVGRFGGSKPNFLNSALGCQEKLWNDVERLYAKYQEN